MAPTKGWAWILSKKEGESMTSVCDVLQVFQWELKWAAWLGGLWGEGEWVEWDAFCFFGFVNGDEKSQE